MDIKQKPVNGTIPLFPNHLTTEAAVALAVLGLVFIIAGVAPRELGPPANPVMTPSHIVPEWYFLWIFGLLKIVPQTFGLILAGFLGLVVIILPWLDRSDSRKPEKRPWVIISTEIVLVVLVALTYIGLKG